MLTLLAALALLAAEPAAPEDPASPLDGCQAVPTAGIGWSYHCASFTAELEDSVERTADYVHGVEIGHEASLGPGAQRSRARRRLAGVEADVHRVQAADGGRTAYVTALRRPEGTRVLTCVTTGAGADCDAVLELLAGQPWRPAAVPGTAVQREPPLAVRGEPVTLPPGCKGRVSGNGGGAVECAPFSVVWGNTGEGPEMERVVAAFDREVVGQFRKPPFTMVQDQVPCTVAALAATCQRALVSADGQTAVVLWGAAAADGQATFAFCMAPHRTPLPLPCSLLFRLVAAAPPAAPPPAPAEPAAIEAPPPAAR